MELLNIVDDGGLAYRSHGLINCDDIQDIQVRMSRRSFDHALKQFAQTIPTEKTCLKFEPEDDDDGFDDNDDDDDDDDSYDDAEEDQVMTAAGDCLFAGYFANAVLFNDKAWKERIVVLSFREESFFINSSVTDILLLDAVMDFVGKLPKVQKLSLGCLSVANLPILTKLLSATPSSSLKVLSWQPPSWYLVQEQERRQQFSRERNMKHFSEALSTKMELLSFRSVWLATKEEEKFVLIAEVLSSTVPVFQNSKICRFVPRL